MNKGGHEQWIRKASLILRPAEVPEGILLPKDATGGVEQALDLSEMHFRFSIQTADAESPNNATIRVYNLSDATAKKVRGEYSGVIVQAGYEGSFGTIFQGNIKQFRTGRESGVDKFLDIFAADGDIGYNQGFVNRTLAAGHTSADILAVATEAMGLAGVKTAAVGPHGVVHYTLPRGKVLFGMARDPVRNVAAQLGATWSIQNGVLQVTPLQGYLPGEAVVINKATGMIGIPEQTDQGISVRTLLNPRLRIGGLFELNNASITRSDLLSIVPFDTWAGTMHRAPLSGDDDEGDGTYRLLVIEHTGDTRGQEWYSDLVGLAFDPSIERVESGA